MTQQLIAAIPLAIVILAMIALTRRNAGVSPAGTAASRRRGRGAQAGTPASQPAGRRRSGGSS